MDHMYIGPRLIEIQTYLEEGQAPGQKDLFSLIEYWTVN
jgi:hypothetical protein